MKGILFLTALILPTFAPVFVRCIKMLMVPCVVCGTRTQGSTACSDPAQAELLAAAGLWPAAGRLRISVKIQI